MRTVLFHFFVLLLLILVATSRGATPENYTLQPNDLIEIKVFQEDDLTTKARVAAEGSITFPLVGRVALGGRSVSGAAESIPSALAKDYIINPQVTLNVVEFDKRRLTVLGQVQRGGTLLYPENETLTLLQAIGLAGGYMKITLKRRVEKKDVIFKLNAKTMARDDTATDFMVLPGGTITVGESIF